MEIRTAPIGEPLEDLEDWYAWPEGRAWLRCMMLTTLDGAARGADGLSGSLSCPADEQVFAEVRRFAHAILVGAGTIRAEGYQPVQARSEDVDLRLRLGLGKAPVLVVVSASLDLPWHSAVFRGSTMRPVIVTSVAAPVERLSMASDCCDVISLEGTRLDPIQFVSALAYKGLTRIVCEGGPHLLAQLSEARLIDEADITIAPTLAGGGQVPTGPAAADPAQLRLASIIERDGWLFTRYVRGG